MKPCVSYFAVRAVLLPSCKLDYYHSLEINEFKTNNVRTSYIITHYSIYAEAQ
jgi:hypothetical protein